MVVFPISLQARWKTSEKNVAWGPKGAQNSCAHNMALILWSTSLGTSSFPSCPPNGDVPCGVYNIFQAKHMLHSQYATLIIAIHMCLLVSTTYVAHTTALLIF